MAIGIIILFAMGFYGMICNGRWKASELGNMINPLKLMLMGILGWVGLILLLVPGNIGPALLCLAIDVLLILPKALAMGRGMGSVKDGVLFGLLVFEVCLGKILRGVLCFTLIGIPICRMVEAMAVNPYEFLMEWMAQNERNSADEARRRQQRARMESFSTPRREEPRVERRVEVTRQNGMMTEHLKVSSDGKRFYDPEDGEWHPIR